MIHTQTILLLTVARYSNYAGLTPDVTYCFDFDYIVRSERTFWKSTGTNTL